MARQKKFNPNEEIITETNFERFEETYFPLELEICMKWCTELKDFVEIKCLYFVRKLECNYLFSNCKCY